MTKTSLKCIAAAIAIATTGLSGAQAAANWFPYKAEATEPAFASDGARKEMDYTPLPRAAKKWKICVSFPHMKDAYWLGVNYGIAEEARRLGVEMQLMEAGGYTNLNKQISQIEDCVTRGAQAVVVGAISGEGLNNVLKTIAAKNIPIIDVINGISSKDISAKSLVSFYTMGHATGEYLARKHPAGDKPVKVGWFPGPAGAAWVEAAHKGFMDAIKGSAVVALDPKFGDTGKEVQAKMVEDVLQANPDIGYIAGTAVTAEAAVGILRSRNLDRKVNLLSFYMTPGVYEGIRNGRIMSAPADSMVIQGRIAIDQAVRLLEGKALTRHVGPKIFVIDQGNINQVNKDDILPPTGFKAVFNVN